MQRAVNPDTGEVLYLVNNQWVPPAQVATNPKTGELAHLVGNEWQIMPVAKTNADLPAPESDLKAGLMAGTKLSPDAPPMGNRMISEVGQAPLPITKEIPQFDNTKMPTAEDRAATQFGLTPEMGMGEKALRTAKGSLYGAATGLEQTWLGGARMISDITGLGKEGVEGVSKQLSKEQQAVENTYAPEYGLKIAKNIGSSVIQNIPTIGAGIYAGAPAALANMFTQSFMQTYDDSRNEGLGVGASTARSALYGTAEALGESIGLPNLLKGAKEVLKGVPTADLAKEFTKYFLKEIPGEQLTYVSQFLTDKGFGLNPEAGMKEFVQGAIDTALVTVGQTALMGGAGFATNKILKDLRSYHSKGEEGIPKAADMMKQAGFTFEKPAQGQPTAQPQVTPEANLQPTPQVQPQEVVQPAVNPSVTPPSGAIQPTDIEEETSAPVEAAPAKPTFDEWRTKQGLMFGSKEEYEAALPKLKAQYEAEMSGSPAVAAEEPVVAPVETPKAEAPATKEEKAKEKALRGINAAEVPLHEFQLGIIAGMEGKAANPEIVSKDAIELLKANNLVKQNADGTLALLPKGNNLLNDIREFTKPMGKSKTADEQKALFSKFIPQLETGEPLVAPTAPAEVVAEEELPRRSKAKDVPVIPEGQTVDSTDPAILKKFSEIVKTYKSESGHAYEDSFLDAINNDVRSKKEKISAPPFKKGATSSANIEVAPFNGGWVSGGYFMSNTGGYASGPSIWDDVHPTKQDAINAEIDNMRKYAESYGDKKAQTWLNSIDPRLTKEGKAATNKARQTEKKAKAKENLGTVENVEDGKKVSTTYEREPNGNITITKETPEGTLVTNIGGKKTSKAKQTFTAKEETKAVKEAKPAKTTEAVDYAKIKKAAENQVDQAIKRTKYDTQKAYDDAKIPEAERYVDFKIEGAGSFKIMNNKERLEEFKRKLANAIKPKQAGLPRREWQSAAVGFKAESAFKNFLDDGEADTAVAIANITGLDINKVVLTPAQKKSLEKFMMEQKEAGNEPMAETIKSKPGANVLGLAKILGPQLYGSMKDVTPVSVKEMIQNSFDAIKSTLEKGQIKKGFIQIDMKQATRTIEIKDNGSGMTPDTLANTFLTIAGTNKETEFGSGGFGIAKMLFLFGNKDIEVTTMRDGKIAHMETTGPQLMAALEDSSQAPDIEIMTPEEYGVNSARDDFPDGHGTIVTVTVPETYIDQSTGKTEKIDFDSSKYSNPVLRYSPLFADIDVSMNGSPIDIGSKFPADDYTTFVNAKFKWGTARIYVSKEQAGKHGENLHVLSNGLWQFSNRLGKKPMSMGSENIPYVFYIDIVSKVKPNEPGYPFALNRKGFSQEAGKDLSLIQKYLWLNYMQKDFASTSTSFGNVEYVSKRNGKIETSPKESLNPDVEVADIKDKIDEGSKVEVKDGKLIVNGKEIPELSQEDLSKAEINIDELQIDQDKIDPNKVMIHDNLEVNANPDAIKQSKLENQQLEIIRKQDKLREEKTALATMNLLGKKKIDDQIKDLDDEFSKIVEEKYKLNPKQEFTPITEAARREFGDRFDNFMYDIGDVFMALRDRIVYLNKVGKLPDHKTWKGDKSYAELAKEAIGISFDKEYRGVSIRLPFAGLFINPAFPEFINTPEEAGFGLFGTMIHELAHHQVRSHDADFPAEMQRLSLILKSDKDFDLQGLEKALVDSVAKNKDILDYLNKAGLQNDSRSIGQRFKDGSFEGAAERTSEDMAKPRGEGQPGRGIPSELRPSYQAIGQKPEPKSVQTKGEAAREVDELIKKHNRSDTPLHPSGTVADAFMGSVQTAKKIAQRVKENPVLVVPSMISKTDRAMTYVRNKNVWYGTGLEQADFSKYNGQLKDSHGTAVASVAVTNAIHAGHVGTQVMIRGKLEFDPKLQMFVAKKSKDSMANVITLKSELANKLGAQTANNLINGYFEAKRSRSIINEYLNREAAYEDAIDSGENEEEAAKNLKNIEVARQKVNMSDEEMDDFIGMEKKYPELRKMMDNWTAVNHNMLDNMQFSGILSKKRAQQLKDIEDYVPWYRIMDNSADINTPTGGVVRTLTHVGKEKTFKQGKVDRDIDDIVDNMIHNVMMMTRNSMRNYAANRVVMEYGTRKENGKLKVFPQEDHANGIFSILAAGRRINVQIADPLVAEAVIGMENVNIPMFKMMEAFTGTTANILRRTITTNPVFQLKQVFKDAPTAAWVSGMRNPFPIWGSTFSSFIAALKPNDPIVAKLKAAGIGGFQSTARSPEKELKIEIGLLNHSGAARILKVLDHIGDASDYAQRRAIYKKVLEKTGDEMQALIQANNVIDFLKRGSSGTAQFLSRNVAFMNAYAQQIDVLAQTLAGGGLKGRSRKEALKNMAILGSSLGLMSLMYCFAIGDDPEYQELDDATKTRNIFIPKSLTKYAGMDRALMLPMNTSASFFFKAMPELLYNKITKEGTKFEVDNTRLRKSIKEAMVDSLLGPNPIPTGVKPFVEIALNKNFFTGGNVTPKGMENLDASEQYNANTSELGKTLSGLMNGALNPMEADHLMRSLGGSVAAMAMWGSNLFDTERPADEMKNLPIVGQFVLKDVPRGAEDLFYDFKQRSDEKYNTWNKMMEREKFDEADKYFDKHEGLIAAHDYVTSMDQALKDLNKEIRGIGEAKDKTYTPGDKRKDITDLQRIKLEMLEDIRQERKDSGL